MGRGGGVMMGTDERRGTRTGAARAEKQSTCGESTATENGSTGARRGIGAVGKIGLGPKRTSTVRVSADELGGVVLCCGGLHADSPLHEYGSTCAVLWNSSAGQQLLQLTIYVLGNTLLQQICYRCNRMMHGQLHVTL